MSFLYSHFGIAGLISSFSSSSSGKIFLSIEKSVLSIKSKINFLSSSSILSFSNMLFSSIKISPVSGIIFFSFSISSIVSSIFLSSLYLDTSTSTSLNFIVVFKKFSFFSTVSASICSKVFGKYSISSFLSEIFCFQLYF